MSVTCLTPVYYWAMLKLPVMVLCDHAVTAGRVTRAKSHQLLINAFTNSARESVTNSGNHWYDCNRWFN